MELLTKPKGLERGEKMDKRGEIYVLEIVIVSILVLSFIYMGFLFYIINYPILIAKRDYLLKHPEQTVVTELQRGGEFPEIKVNLNK